MIPLPARGTQGDVARVEMRGEEPMQRALNRSRVAVSTRAVKGGGPVALPVVDVRARMGAHRVFQGRSLTMAGSGTTSAGVISTGPATGRLRHHVASKPPSSDCVTALKT